MKKIKVSIEFDESAMKNHLKNEIEDAVHGERVTTPLKIIMSPQQIARYFNTDMKEVYSAIYSGRLISYQHGRQWMVRFKDAVRWYCQVRTLGFLNNFKINDTKKQPYRKVVTSPEGSPGTPIPTPGHIMVPKSQTHPTWRSTKHGRPP